MNRPRLPVVRLGICVILSTLAWTSGTRIGLAQEYVPPDRGLPGHREGGGTRGNCFQSQQTLVALMPDTNFGQTIAERPTFFWYVPQTTVNTAEFLLLDENGNEVYQTTLQLEGNPGLVSLTLPVKDTSSLLEVGKDYHWYFSLVCDQQDRSGDIFAEGWIQRIQPDSDLTRRLTRAAASDRPSIYAQAGIWHDALSSLADLRRSQPRNSDLTDRWRNLLESVGLNSLSTEPLTQCYSPLLREQNGSAQSSF